MGKMPLSKVCEEVMDACLSEDPRHTAGIGGDNMTCIIVLVSSLNSVPTLPKGRSCFISLICAVFDSNRAVMLLLLSDDLPCQASAALCSSLDVRICICTSSCRIHRMLPKGEVPPSLYFYLHARQTIVRVSSWLVCSRVCMGLHLRWCKHIPKTVTSYETCPDHTVRGRRRNVFPQAVSPQ